jgi:hypothetical protein
MKNLNLRQPLIYLTPNCIACNKIENTLHLLQCNQTNYNLPNILNNLLTNTLQKLKINSTFISSIYNQILNFSTSDLAQTILLISQGTIPLQITTNINQYLTKHTSNFLIELSNQILTWLYNTVWFKRNEQVHLWENLRGIDQITKRTKIHLPLSPKPLHTIHIFDNNIDTTLNKILTLGYTPYNAI